jgi:phosphatidylglycerophosphate synthase
VSRIEVVASAVVFGLWLVGVPLYALRVRMKGHYLSVKVRQKGGTFLLGRWLMQYGYWVIHSASDVLARLRVRPNTVTGFSLALAVAAGAAIFFGLFGLGGWLMLTAGILDVIDGMIARQTGQTSPGGWYLDSVVDRYCEFFIFIGFLGYYFPFLPLGALISALALVASVMITFNRTKGETLGIRGVPSGLMRRHERLFYIGVGTAAAPIVAYFVEPGATRPVFHTSLVAQGLVAVLGNITAVRLASAFYRRIEHEQPDIPELRELRALASDDGAARDDPPAAQGGGKIPSARAAASNSAKSGTSLRKPSTG